MGSTATPRSRCCAWPASSAQWRPVDVVTSYLGAHALPPEFKDDRDGLSGPRLRRGDARRGPGKGLPMRSMPSARGLPSRSKKRAGCSRRQGPIGLPVKLHAEQLSNLGGAAAGGGLRRAVGRSHRISRPGGRGRHRRIRHRGRAAAGRLLLPARNAGAAGGGPAQGRRAHRHRDRPQPRLLARPLAARHHEHGLRAVRPDAGGSAARRHRQCREGAGPQRPRHDRAGPQGRHRAVGRRAAGRACLSAGLQSARRRDPRRRSDAGDARDERRPAALCQGEGPHPREHPLRRLGSRAAAFPPRTSWSKASASAG